MIGRTTWESENVGWEIEKSLTLGKPVICVKLVDEDIRIPEALDIKEDAVLPWNTKSVLERLKAEKIKTMVGWLFPQGQENISEGSKPLLFEHYKLIIENPERLMARRQGLHSFFSDTEHDSPFRIWFPEPGLHHSELRS